MNNDIIEISNKYIFIRNIIYSTWSKSIKIILEKEYKNDNLWVLDDYLKFEFKILNLLEYIPKTKMKHKITPDIEIINNNYDNLCSDKIKLKKVKLDLNILPQIVVKEKTLSNKEKKSVPKKNIQKTYKIVNLEKNGQLMNTQEKYWRKKKNKQNITNHKKSSIISNNIKFNEKLFKEPHTYNHDGTILPLKYNSKKNLKYIFSQIKPKYNESQINTKINNKNKYFNINKLNNQSSYWTNLNKIEVKSSFKSSFKKINKNAIANVGNKLSINGIAKPFSKNSSEIKIKDNLSLLEFGNRKKNFEKQNIIFNNIKKNNKPKPMNLKPNNISFIEESKVKSKSINIINKNSIKESKILNINNYKAFNDLIN